MAKSGNEGSAVDGDISAIAGGPAKSPTRVKNAVPKKFPPDPIFLGFLKKPFVYLPRYDITPYLNSSKKPAKPTLNGKLSKIRNHESVHEKRLSQKCVVKLIQDDLEKLKAPLKAPFKAPLKAPPDSDSEDSCTDPTMACKCQICNKSYNSEKKLHTHQRKKHIIYVNSKPMKRVSFSDHVIIHEVKEYHKCRKCPKIFKDYRSLKLHTKQEHKKRKCYICNYCNKNFAERMIFKVHIKLHCEVCGQLFLSKTKCIEHKRNVCRVIKLHKCKICSQSFYGIMDLKDHSYEHDDACFVCDICKDRFESKCMIAHHISFLHAKKRPRSLYTMRKMGNERLYLCNFCDLSSVERDIVENHTEKLPDLKNRAMTGYKDYYFCDVCMKKFATELEMVQHKWTHFLKTTDNSQTRQSILKSLQQPKHKTTYNVNEELPLHFQPKLVIDKLKIDEGSTSPLEFIDVELPAAETNVIYPHNLKKAIVDPKSKKTLLSKHQCETCRKYFYNNYCLNRHIATQHGDFDNLRCKVCEETFVWPSLLRTHKCIRLYHQEMPFDDARPEIHFDNLHETQYGFEDLEINDTDDYLHSIDFEIPAPIVEMTEGDAILSLNQSEPGIGAVEERNIQFQGLGYKLVMQEVPIEF